MTTLAAAQEAVLSHLSGLPRHRACARIDELVRATRLPAALLRRAVLSLETHGVVGVARLERRARLRGRNPIPGASGWLHVTLEVYLPQNSPYLHP